MIFLAIMTSLPAQQPAPFVVEPPPNAAYPDYGPGNAVASRLRREPAKMFTFDRASLRDVLRYLADDARIPFVGIPESDAANKRLVTFTMESSPFTALESVCRDNGIRLSYENGVWHMRTVDEERERRLKEEDDNKLVGIAYRLRYDPVDRVDFRLDPSAGGTASQVSNSGPNSITATGANMPLQNSQRVFSAKAPRIVNEIRVMLGLTPISYGPDGLVLGESTTAGTNAQSTSAVTTQEAAPNSPQRLNPTYVPPQMPQVIYNSDTNTLWVVATRAQHKWVADYLIAVDQPQVLIAIEVKFFETTKNPSKEFGINWKGTMHPDPLTGDGGIKVAARDITAEVGGPIEIGDTGQTIKSGYGTSTSTIDGVTTKASGFAFSAPYSAVLTTSDVQLALQAFMSDDKTSMVQYPRVLTVNNREVAITSAENTPINAGVTSVSSTVGASSQNVGTLGYLPVGTQINILPKSVGIDQVALTVAITISDILRFEPLNLGTGSNLYPVTSERVYNASLQVNSGYTLAVGGLETTGDTRFDNGIPLLQDIPGVGYLFRSKTRTRKKKNLIIFITPTLIVNPKATRGIGETPEAVVPVRPNDPTPPAFTPDGQLVGGYDAINAAFAWFDFQIKWFKQINKENRTDKESIRQLRAVIASARMLVQDISAMQEAHPERADQLARLEERAVATLTELNRVLAAAQDNVM